MVDANQPPFFEFTDLLLKVVQLRSPALTETLESATYDCCVRSNGHRQFRDASIHQQKIDFKSIETAVHTILRAGGEHPDHDGLLETPRRVAKMYAEMFSGLQQDPGRHLEVTFEESYGEIVLVRDIPFTSMCEHHLLPFRGVAHVAYIPNGRVTELSKLARAVEEVSRRPQVQERMTQTLADLTERRLGSRAVGLIVKAEHSCMPFGEFAKKAA